MRTDKVPNKGTVDKLTSYSTDNMSKEVELKAAELQCAVLGEMLSQIVISVKRKVER